MDDKRKLELRAIIWTPDFVERYKREVWGPDHDKLVADLHQRIRAAGPDACAAYGLKPDG